MKNYIENVSKLRKSMTADIEEFLKNANRAIFTKAGALSYLCYDLATTSTSDEELELVPDIEITMLAFHKEFGFIFVDAHGHEGTPSELSTDELWDVCDYLYDIEHQAESEYEVIK